MKKIFSTIISAMLVLTSFAGFGQSNKNQVYRHNAPAGNVNFNRNPTAHSKKDMKRQAADFSQPKYGEVVKNAERQQKVRAKTGRGI